ncbi:MAG: glycosyltransferase family 2 protein [Pyrinomonadaceae bacterium]
MQEFTKNNKVTKLVGKDVISDAPHVSIITPAYNIAEYISETLDSVFAQTFRNFEIIVVNDGSPDTEEFERVLEPYFDKIVYLKHENIGAGAARNAAIENARGELIAFLDGDDVWFPEFLASQIEFLENNNLAMVYADAVHFGGSELDGVNYMQKSPSVGEANFESLLDLRCNVITSGTVVRKKNIIEAGMFETEKVRAHDFHLWLRIAGRGAQIGYQRKVLLKYRVRPGNLTGDAIQQIKREIDVYQRVLDKIELTDREKKIVDNQLQRLKAALEFERGKQFFFRKDFSAARNSFEKANRFQYSSKLKAFIWMMKIAPKSLLRIYQLVRADDTAFLSKKEKRTN